jgi:hypothetical protein
MNGLGPNDLIYRAGDCRFGLSEVTDLGEWPLCTKHFAALNDRIRYDPPPA